MALNYTSVDRIYDIEPMVGSVSDLTSAQIVTFAEHAEAHVNAKLARSYSVPVAGAPVLDAISTDLAIYRILSRRIFPQDRLQNSDWPDRFKEAEELLDALASNEVLLPSSDGTIVAQRTDEAEVKTTTEGYHPTMWEGPWTEQIQDADKIDDQSVDRDLVSNTVLE